MFRVYTRIIVTLPDGSSEDRYSESRTFDTYDSALAYYLLREYQTEKIPASGVFLEDLSRNHACPCFTIRPFTDYHLGY